MSKSCKYDGRRIRTQTNAVLGQLPHLGLLSCPSRHITFVFCRSILPIETAAHDSSCCTAAGRHTATMRGAFMTFRPISTSCQETSSLTGAPGRADRFRGQRLSWCGQICWVTPVEGIQTGFGPSSRVYSLIRWSLLKWLLETLCRGRCISGQNENM